MVKLQNFFDSDNFLYYEFLNEEWPDFLDTLGLKTGQPTFVSALMRLRCRRWAPPPEAIPPYISLPKANRDKYSIETG